MLIKYVLLILGLYYLLTGLWSIIDIESFSDFTRYRGDFFLKHTAGVLFSVLGLIFTYSAIKERFVAEIKYFALLTTVGVMAVEFYYLPKIGNPLPFWIDFTIEGIAALLIFFTIMSLWRMGG